MTNTLNTPIEALEHDYPFLVEKCRFRPGSGGRGKYRGGHGLVREIKVLSDCQVTILSERRRFAPYGLAGGQPGKPGQNYLITLDGRRKKLPSKVSLFLKAGEKIDLATPGGGGWGGRCRGGACPLPGRPQGPPLHDWWIVQCRARPERSSHSYDTLPPLFPGLSFLLMPFFLSPQGLAPVGRVTAEISGARRRCARPG